MKTRFAGPLGGFMKQHLRLRRSLGYDLRTEEFALDQFDAHVAETFPSVETVTRSMVVSYLRATTHLQSCTRQSQLSSIRQFCRFLFQLKPDTYVPESHLLSPARSRFHPHIYAVDEVNQLMERALRLQPDGSLRPHTYATLIGLLWVSGLRVGEAIRLNLEDVDREQAILYIRQTKNSKSRLVPPELCTHAGHLRQRG